MMENITEFFTEESGVDAGTPESEVDAYTPTQEAPIADEGENLSTLPEYGIHLDVSALKEEFPHVGAYRAAELVDEERYAELRALGLSAKEAFLATAKSRPARPDNRAHLSGSVPRTAYAPGGAMTPSELTAARELFRGMSDEDIKNLYRKVTK